MMRCFSDLSFTKTAMYTCEGGREGGREGKGRERGRERGEREKRSSTYPSLLWGGEEREGEEEPLTGRRKEVA